MSIYCFKQVKPSREVEIARTICRREDGQLVWGSEATGDATSVRLVLRCSEGSKPFGIFHSHPLGTSEPSSQDLMEFERAFHLQGIARFCIKNGKLSCYQVR